MISQTEQIHGRVEQGLATVFPQLAWVPDTLIPEDEELGMPSATQAGLQDKLLPQALRARDDLIDAFVSALKRLPAEAPTDPLQALYDLGDDFHLVGHLIAGSYFLSKDVCEKLGYTGQQAMAYEPDYDEITDTAERIIGRGAVYVDPQTGARAKS
ncbi:hypothetical protein V2V90_24990 (plasmid) [Agrobacterium leguminum]|uniref:hypothetical protein n=1 Tax=Agrobacterium leguminum TaxID=2792015 RepID=UPI0030D10EED